MTNKHDDYIQFAVVDKPVSSDWQSMINDLDQAKIDYYLREHTQRNGTVEVSLFMSQSDADRLATLLEIYDL